jgi:hypothetical protein
MPKSKEIKMADLTNRKCFRNVFMLLAVFFLLGGVPTFSQEIIATYGVGGQFTDYERSAIGGGLEPLAEGMLWDVNVLFIGKSGLTVSTEIDVISDFQTAVLTDPLIGLGYVYYKKFYAGAIFNIIPVPVIVYDDHGATDNWGTQQRADIFMVPTFVCGYDFGPVLLGGQLSYMRGILSAVTGYRFTIGVGINVGNTFK